MDQKQIEELEEMNGSLYHTDTLKHGDICYVSIKGGIKIDWGLWNDPPCGPKGWGTKYGILKVNGDAPYEFINKIGNINDNKWKYMKVKEFK